MRHAVTAALALLLLAIPLVGFALAWLLGPEPGTPPMNQPQPMPQPMPEAPLPRIVVGDRAPVAAPAEGLGRHVAELAERRREQLRRLARYINGGAYPRNPEAGPRHPIMLDERGTACAVGQLLIDDGRDDIVRAIVASDNQLVLRDAPAEGPLIDWIATSGLLREECERIQPTYGFEDALRNQRRREQRRVRAHLTGVFDELTADGFERLCRAFDRLLPRLEERGAPATGFAHASRAGGVFRVANAGFRALEVRALAFDDDLCLRRVGDWTPLTAGAGCALELGAPHAFVEWRAPAPLPAGGETITLR